MNGPAPRTADRHVGAYSAGLAFDRQRSFIVANAPGIAIVVLLAGVGSLAVAFWIPGTSLLRAYAAGAFFAAAVGYLAHWVSVASGSTGSAMGQVAEQWTATELRRLRRRGWKYLNSVMFRRWDVDHIAVGPNGVIVIETKWRSDPVDLAQPDEYLLRAANRLHRDERDVAGHLGWGTAVKPDAWITSVLVVWGPSITQSEEGLLRIRDGVYVLAGEHLRENLAELTEQALTSDEIDAVFDKLDTQARKRDGADSTTWRTVQDAAGHALAVALVGLLGAYLSLLATRLDWWYFAVAAVFAAGGVVGLRSPRVRPWARSWLIGTQLVTVAVAAAVLVQAVA